MSSILEIRASNIREKSRFSAISSCGIKKTLNNLLVTYENSIIRIDMIYFFIKRPKNARTMHQKIICKHSIDQKGGKKVNIWDKRHRGYGKISTDSGNS